MKKIFHHFKVFLLVEFISDGIREGYYIKKIKRKIEDFRIMNDEEQGKNFGNFSDFIKSNLVEGDFDNKIHIKYLMRFIKIIKTRIFLVKKNAAEVDAEHAELIFVCAQALVHIEKFINELHGVEKIKEDNFLNILSHEDQVKLNTVLTQSLISFRVIINALNNPNLIFDKISIFFDEMKTTFNLETNNIKKIFGGGLKKITEQEKIDKLKKSSKIFRKKAVQYRRNSWLFLLGAAVPLVGIVVLAIYSDFFDYSIEFPEKTDIDSSTFYIYFISKILFSGRLLFAIMTLAGFFYCLRFYAASQHNAIICEQRANTLGFFDALYENVEEDKEKLLVVEKVLNSATEHLPTGFSKLQSDSGGGVDLSTLASLFKRS